MVIAFGAIALVSGLALILSVMFQTAKAESFGAALGGGSGLGGESRFKPGSREEWLYKITRVSAVVWLVSLTIMTVAWYHTQ